LFVKFKSVPPELFCTVNADELDVVPEPLNNVDPLTNNLNPVLPLVPIFVVPLKTFKLTLPTTD
jgi:hypothetical protein